MVHGNEYPCLTWEFRQDKLKLICRILRFSLPVSLIDNQGQWYATCTFTGTTHDCTSVGRKDLIAVDYVRNSIVFPTAKVDEMMNGIWVCLQDNLRLTTHVSLSKGIIDSTEIFIKGTLLKTSSENAKYVLNCFSCREPDGNNVEFLVNGRTEDSITYSSNSEKCTHHKGECYPTECSCDANEFTRAFPYDLKSVVRSYSCDMLFTDPFTHAKFSVLSTVVYDGKEFNTKNTSTSIIKVADKIWNQWFTVNREIEMTTEFNQSYSTLVPEISDNNSIQHTDGLQLILQVISIVISVAVGSMFIIFLIYKHRKAKVTRTSTTNKIDQKSKDTELMTSTMSSSLVSMENSTKDQTSLDFNDIDRTEIP